MRILFASIFQTKNTFRPSPVKAQNRALTFDEFIFRKFIGENSYKWYFPVAVLRLLGTDKM